jgi:lysophospholipase L1-like esterase
MKLFTILLLATTFAATAQGQDWAGLNRYADANRELPPPAKHERRVVFMGNSITEGWVKADSAFFSSRYVGRGISGQTTGQMLVRFRADVINLKPAVVVILAGTNDIAENNGPTTLEAILGTIVSMAELARANKIRVVLCSVLPAYDYPWRRGLHPDTKIPQLNAMIRAYAEANRIPYVDYFTPMADERNGLKAGLSKDGVHPLAAGYAIMKPLMEAGIRQALR